MGCIATYNHEVDCSLQLWGRLQFTITGWIAIYNYEVDCNLQSRGGLQFTITRKIVIYNHGVDYNLHSRGGLQFTITGWIGTHYPNAAPNTIVLWLPADRVHLPDEQKLPLLQ